MSRAMAKFGLGPRRDDEGRREYARRCSDWIQQRLDTVGQRQGGREWATAVLDRYADGDAVPDISVRWACEVTGQDETAIREMVRADRERKRDRVTV